MKTLITAVLAAQTLFATPAQAAPAEDIILSTGSGYSLCARDYTCLYEFPNLNQDHPDGSVLATKVSIADLDNLPGHAGTKFVNRTSSVFNHTGKTVVLYMRTNYGGSGACVPFGGYFNDLRDFDDATASVKFVDQSPC